MIICISGFIIGESFPQKNVDGGSNSNRSDTSQYNLTTTTATPAPLQQWLPTNASTSSLATTTATITPTPNNTNIIDDSSCCMPSETGGGGGGTNINNTASCIYLQNYDGSNSCSSTSNNSTANGVVAAAAVATPSPAVSTNYSYVSSGPHGLYQHHHQPQQQQQQQQQYIQLSNTVNLSNSSTDANYIIHNPSGYYYNLTNTTTPPPPPLSSSTSTQQQQQQQNLLQRHHHLHHHQYTQTHPHHYYQQQHPQQQHYYYQQQQKQQQQQQQQQHSGAIVIAGSGIGIGMGMSMGINMPPVINMQQHKKSLMRSSNEMLKRTRAPQNAYELSQDLLEKQIELLERKYGGVCARNAAITIQRAFRHYMMVKKFASITAMAKAEKRLSRRMLINNNTTTTSGSGVNVTTSIQQQHHHHYNYNNNNNNMEYRNLQQQPRVTIMAGPPPTSSTASATGSGATCSGGGSTQTRTPPTRSLSMRERRQLDGSPIPRSQSGSSTSLSILAGGINNNMKTTTTTPHPHVNLLHAIEPNYATTTTINSQQQHRCLLQQQQQQHDGSFNSSNNSSYLDLSLNSSTQWSTSGGGIGSICSTSSSSAAALQQQFHNNSGCSGGSASPHTPYYSAAQIYMRPKGVVCGVGISKNSTTPPPPAPPPPSSSSSQLSTTPPTTTIINHNNNINNKRIPPEVPKRTSSITQQQQLQLQQKQLKSATATCVLRTNGLCKTEDNGSLTSVQSSGSDSSVTSVDRILNSDLGSDCSNSPHTWKRVRNYSCSQQQFHTTTTPPSQLITTTAINNNNNNSGININDIPTNIHVNVGCGGGGGSGSGCGGAAAVASNTEEQLLWSQSSSTVAATQQQQQHHNNTTSGGGNTNTGIIGMGVGVVTTQDFKVSETIRKRQYRVGLNLFNKKPEKGVTYLIRRGFLENTPQGVARFLISRKGLSRQMIGEYLGNLQNHFNMTVLNCFALELDLSGMHVDVALRKFQTYFRMPGEAQKIERLMEIFSQRYCQCNQDIVGRLRSSDTVFVLAFAIIMLNTDLHTPNLKPERRMRLEDFIKNLRGIDDCHDIDRDLLVGIYERVKAAEFKPGSDHVTQVMKVQGTIVGKKPNLALPHRRLVCYCRLYEIPDINKRERAGVHQREVFLFNDLLVITKIFSKKKSSVTYTFRNSYPLCGMVVSLLDVPNYPYCIQLSQKVDNKILITFNARNEHDRCKFADDLKESISEMDEMESLRIEAELDRQKSARNRATSSTTTDNRDSGVADVEMTAYHHHHHHHLPHHHHNAQKLNAAADGSILLGSSGGINNIGGSGVGIIGNVATASTAASAVGGSGNVGLLNVGVTGNETSNITTTNATAQQLKRSALSNSLLDMHEQFGNDKPQRRGSVGSLDSGMSISFQSTTTSSVSRENAADAAAKMRYTLSTLGMPDQQQQQHSHHSHHHHHQQQQQQQQLFAAIPIYNEHNNTSTIYVPQINNNITTTINLNKQQQPQHNISGINNNINNNSGGRTSRERKLSNTDGNGRITDV